MSLRPLIEIAAENERLHALAGRVRDAAAGGEQVGVRHGLKRRVFLEEVRNAVADGGGVHGRQYIA